MPPASKSNKKPKTYTPRDLSTTQVNRSPLGKSGTSQTTSATPTKATTGLLPTTDYKYNTFIGNTQAVRDAYQKTTGFVQNPQTASGFSPASVANQPAKWQSAYDAYMKQKGLSTPSYGSLSRIGGFAPSQAYLDAMAYTQGLLDKINSGRTSYSDKIDEMMKKIEGREKFNYDFANDPLFQNALASAMASGQTAMQDTIGQASALTGGYGSSYATSAANQAYNQYVQSAYEQLPEFYQMALNAYNMEGQELYNQLGMYRDADNSEYGRLMDAYSANYAQAQNLYNQEYSNYWDTANYNFNVDKYNADARAKASNEAWERYKDSLNLKTSGSTTDETGAKESTVKNIKSEGKELFSNIAYGTDKYYEWLSQMANNYGLSDAQIQEIDTYVKKFGKSMPNLKPYIDSATLGTINAYNAYKSAK